MKKYIYRILIALIIFAIHYLFIEVLRSEIYIYVMFGVDMIIGLISFIESVSYVGNKNISYFFYTCVVYITSSVIITFTNIGVSDKTSLYTIQMTYTDGYTRTATYELPDDAEFYLSGGGRYNSRTDLEYRNYPFKGGLIENSIVRYRIVSIKNK